ncbi:MAG: hypothetical protein K6F77_09925 [Lachnospiraceae bacterium]|nr:hypothetical protein [Lachnospiraceae bacterium]
MELTEKEIKNVLLAIQTRIGLYQSDIAGMSKDDPRLKQFKKELKEFKSLNEKFVELL